MVYHGLRGGAFAVAVSLELRVLLLNTFYFLITDAGGTRIAIVEKTRALSSPVLLIIPGGQLTNLTNLW
jgi:hypothetical protein